MRFSALLPLAVVLSAVPVRAKPPPEVAVRLEYLRGPGTASCPGEDVLRSHLMAQFGYDPVKPDASSVLTIAVRRQGGSPSGEVTVVGKVGNVLWREAAPRNALHRHVERSTVTIDVRAVPK